MSVDGRGGCQEAEDGGDQQRLVIQQVSLVVGPISRCNLCIRINILKLAKYFSLEALPASRLDAGDVDKLEYQVQYSTYCTVPYDWMPVGHLDAGDWMSAGHRNSEGES
jgi:hypothetical protein